MSYINESNSIFDYTGKTMNVLGDSISCVTKFCNKFWHEWVKEYLGLAQVNNYAISGTAISNILGGNGNPFCERYIKMSLDADIVVVFGGVNDVWQSGTLGTYGDTGAATVYGAIDILCAGLKTMYPYGTVILCTPTEQNKRIATTGLTVKQVSKAMKEVASKYAIPVLDINSMSNIFPNTPELIHIYTVDGIHLNDNGQKKLGQLIASFLQNGCIGSNNLYVEPSVTIVDVPCTSISLSKTSITFDNDATPVSLIPIKVPGNTTHKTYWKTSDSSIVTAIDGIVTPLSNGDATVNVECDRGIASCKVTIKNFPTSVVNCTGISLSNDTLTFTDENPKTLKATLIPSNTTQDVIWASSSANASVKNGVITPISNGSAQITVSCGSYSASCIVTINMEQQKNLLCTGITLDSKEFILSSKGSSKILSATTIPTNTSDKLTWSSSVSAVATVSDTGEVQAVSNGTAEITASCGKYSDKCLVTVTNIDSSLYASGDTVIDGATTNWILTGYYDSVGNKKSGSFSTTDLVACEPNTQYYSYSDVLFPITYFDSVGNFVSLGDKDYNHDLATKFSFTIPSNVAYFTLTASGAPMLDHSKYRVVKV